MRKHKEYYIVAYDVALAKPRRKISAVLEKYGHRVNRSVFECMLTPAEAYRMKNEIAGLVDRKKDSVVFYQLCMDCFVKVEYCPDIRHNAEVVRVAV